MKEKFKSILPGIFLGLAVFVAVWAVKPVGVSTQFSVLAGMAESVVNPDLIYEDANNKSGYGSTNAYLNKSGGSLAKSIAEPANYSNFFVLAIPFGALIAAAVDPKRKQRAALRKRAAEIPDTNKEMQLALKQDTSGYVKSFASGFILLFGARLADGCTSGHMMSGMMQSSISGFVFALSVFLVAIPVALLTSRPKMK